MNDCRDADCCAEECNKPKNTTQVTKEDTDAIVNNIKLQVTLFDCFLALLFGGQWGAGMFWNDVKKATIEFTIVSTILVSVLVFFFNGYP